MVDENNKNEAELNEGWCGRAVAVGEVELEQQKEEGEKEGHRRAPSKRRRDVPTVFQFSGRG